MKRHLAALVVAPLALATHAGAANTAPTVIIKSATMRGATGLMDVVFRVNDPDDATVKTRALAFIDGQRTFTKVIKPTTFAEGTESKLGDAIASNTDHTLTWNVAADWNISLGQIKFEILAMDTRGLLPLDWVTIPAANGQPELTISKNAPTDQETLDALFWQYASGDPGLVLENDELRGSAASGALHSVPLAIGTTVKMYAHTWVIKSMNFALADIADVERATSARASIASPTRWHALQKPYEPIDVVVRWSTADRQNPTPPIAEAAVPAGLPHIDSISSAIGFPFLVLRRNGTVYSVEAQSTVPENLSGVTAVSAGINLGLALKSDRTVTAWGTNEQGQINIPNGLSNVTMISAGSSHSMALRADGTVVAWGYNGSGQCDVPPGLSGIVSISAGPNASFALRSDGTVVGWGSDSSIADHFSDVKSISASNISHSLIGLKADGTIVQGGDYTPPPYPLSGIIKVANFYQTYLALKDDRTVLAWGEGNSVPRGLSGVSAIAAEIDHAIALKKAP
jgi:hypothetical protein